MKIKKSGGVIIFEAQQTKAVFPLEVGKYKPEDGHDIVMFSKSEGAPMINNGLVITSAGEYETNGIFVYGLSDEPSKVKLFSLDIDGINLMIFNSSDNIIKLLDSDEIAENNVLICNIDGELTNVSDIIDELEPEVFILTGKNDTLLSEALKKLSLAPSDTQTYFTFTEDDFNEEIEKPMQVVLLK